MAFIPISEPELSGNEKKYVEDCMNSEWISSLGDYIPKFEAEFASFCDASYGVSVSNGTVALHLALAVLGIKEGDEVIIPNLTFIATANVVTYLGAKPIFVDVDEKTWTIDVTKIEGKITDKTKAIIPVHLYGHPCDMDEINKIAKKHKLFVIEDAAEAHGARYKGKRVGGLGDIGCFSFYGNKIITTGEGGMCVTNNETLAKELRFLKDHGMDEKRRYFHPKIGFNFRMTNIQAAIGLAQLEQVEKFIEKRAADEKLYRELLKDADVEFQPNAEWAEMVYWVHSILVKDPEKLMKKLKEHDIDSRPFFVPLHEQPPYKESGYPTSSDLANRGVNLPSSTKLHEDDIKRICDVIASF